MLRNYLVTIFRQIRKNKVFSFINLFGLALGMAACLVISQYVYFHTSFDKYHTNAEKVFRIESEAFKNGESLGASIAIPSMLPETLMNQSPLVENVTRFYNYSYANSTLIYKDGDQIKSFEQGKVFGTEKNTFELFDLPFIAGNAEKFNEPQKAILTYSASKKYFESPENAIGSQFTLSGNDGKAEFELVGVIQDLPPNSHLDFELLLSFESIDNYTQARTSWTRTSMISYLYLNDETKQPEVLEEIHSLFDENAREAFQERGFELAFSLMPLKNIHLDSSSSSDFRVGANRSTVMALSIVALIILVIAWINYMNLSLVRTMQRLKEVGIRKCMGSSVRQITYLFILEALVINVIAFGIVLIGIQVFEKPIIDITDLPNSALLDMNVLGILAGLAIIGTLVIGFYPYALLKTVDIVTVLIGKGMKMSGTRLRKSLVFVQFLITFLLIAGTLTVFKQITYMREADLGINIDNVLVLQSPPTDVRNDQTQDIDRFNTLKTELLKQSQIKAISSAGEIPGAYVGWGAGLYLKNQSKENTIRTGLIPMDVDFPHFFEIDLIAGRHLKQGDSPWTRGDVVINAKLAEKLGFFNPEDAIGAEIDGFYGPTLKVIGVVENHHQTSLHDDYQPLAYILSSWTEYYFVKLELDKTSNKPLNNQLTELINTVKTEWSAVYADYPMDYSFLDQSFDQQYKEDIRFGKIFSGFSSLAIVIACMGLFGLTSFTIQQRTKEIGVRKVLGATFNHLMLLLSKEYILLVIAAGIVSSPIAWWMMSNWLQGYTFRIELGWWFYIIPAVFVLALAFLSIISKIMSTIKINPIESLRYE